MSVATETNRAQAAENQLNSLIGNNATNINNFQVNAITAALTTNSGILQSQSSILSQNVMAIAAIENTITSHNTNSGAILLQLASLQQNQAAENVALINEAARAQAAETALAVSISQIVIIPSSYQTALITAETTRASSFEYALQGFIAAETGRAQIAEDTVAGKIRVESTRAKSAEQAIVASIAALASVNGDDVILSGGTLTIGGTSAVTTAINIGHTNLTTSVVGNMSVSGAAIDVNYHDAAFGGYWNGAFGGSTFNANSLCGNVRMFRQGALVTLFFSQCTIQPSDGSQSSTYSKALPYWAWPNANIMCSLVIYSNFQVQIGLLTVTGNGTMIMQTLPYPNWSGTAGFGTETCVSYLV